MVAAGSIFLLCLTTSSYPCRHGCTSDVRRYATQSHKEDGANLGTWANTQRRLKKIGKLNSDKGKQLEEVGFQWRASATWEEMHALLKQFKKREGHCNVPQSHTEDEYILGKWVTTQRHLKKTGKLHSDRDTLLEEVGFQWRASATWEEMHSLVQEARGTL
jgi:Ni,Fe-hydrogenase III large subunit